MTALILAGGERGEGVRRVSFLSPLLRKGKTSDSLKKSPLLRKKRKAAPPLRQRHARQPLHGREENHAFILWQKGRGVTSVGLLRGR